MSNSTERNNMPYGYQDTSYRAAGKEDGLRKLCEQFYENMDQFPEAKKIREMHEESLEVMIDKLTLFLCMWLGGPKTYREKYHFVGMPEAHKHLKIGHSEKEAWLLCMDKAIDEQNYLEDFKIYLKEQLRVPAEFIRKVANQ